MANVQGISWITHNYFSAKFRNVSGAYENSRDLYCQLKEKGIIRKNIKDFGRFDKVSANTCLAISLALFDARIDHSEEKKQDLGILSTNEKGCLQSNINYFKDYVECGRKLSRGNLFIYTLPSTPIAEAAINFRFQGPVLYLTFAEDQTNQILEQGRMMIESKEAVDLLIVNASEEDAVCFLVQSRRASSENIYMALSEMQNLIKGVKTLPKVIEEISKEGQK